MEMETPDRVIMVADMGGCFPTDNSFYSDGSTPSLKRISIPHCHASKGHT